MNSKDNATFANGFSRAASVMASDMYAFAFDTDLTSMVIPEGVTKIGAFAFWLCSRLTSVVIPYGVTEIGPYAFASIRKWRSVPKNKGICVSKVVLVSKSDEDVN